MIQVFFRLVEPSGGKIIIDGIDISRLGLHDLRSRFGIIPQEPVLFEGTVRSNIDPIGQHSDEDIWKVIVALYFFIIFQVEVKKSLLVCILLVYYLIQNFPLIES